MAGDHERATAAPAVCRAGEDDWQAWRQVRLAALADAPDSFGDTIGAAAALTEHDWRAMTRDGAIFIATAGREAVGGPASQRCGGARRRFPG